MPDPSPIRIQVISDIHAEFGQYAVPRREDLATDADIVLIAGDLAASPDAVQLAVALFPNAPALILIGGNHEHYRTGMTVDDGLAAMGDEAALIAARQGRPVALLEDDAIVVQVRGTAVRVLGATFWTDYGLLHQSITHAALCERAINDHRMILGRDEEFFRAREAVQRHRGSRAFLAEALAEPHDGPTIVMTHHLPSMRSVAGRFRREPTSAAFASHADDLIGMGPALWVHGHTHDSCAWRDGTGTLVVCNPAGYARRDGSRENEAFDPRLCVELQQDAEGWRATMPPCEHAITSASGGK